MNQSSSRKSPAESSLIMARFFGRFTCTIHDESIPWLRRMDKRIFRYLLLAPEGRATRDELHDTFWGGQDTKSSHLSLRTACSNIRKAIGTLVGSAETEHYFSTDNDALYVNLERVNVDVRRYIAHIRSGNICYATDDFKAAYGHFKHALIIYRGHLGWGDEPEEWLEPLANQCAALQRSIIEHLAEISRKSGSSMRTLEYEAMLSAQSGGSEVIA